MSAFRIDHETGALTFLNMQGEPRHRPLPPDRRRDGPQRADRQLRERQRSACCRSRRTDRSATPATSSSIMARASIPRGRPARMRTPSRSTPTNRYVFVPDLGHRQGDRSTRFDAERRQAHAERRTSPRSRRRPGAGPRQLVMHPNGRFAYLINELNSTMTAYAYDAANGRADGAADAPDPARRTSPVRAPAPRCRSHPRTAVSSTARTAATTASSSMRSTPRTGTLTLVGHESTRGKIPRNFEIEPDRRVPRRRQPGFRQRRACSGSTRRPAS